MTPSDGETIPWEKAMLAMESALKIEEKALDIRERTGGGLEENVSQVELDAADLKRRRSALRMLSCGLKRPARAEKLIAGLLDLVV